MFEGPIVTVIAGFLASAGNINPYIAYGVIIVADLVGDSMYYVLGRWGKHIGIKPGSIGTIETHFAKHTIKTLLFGKLTHAIGAGILFGAGVARVPYRTFLWYNLLPTLPKSLALLVIGYYFGHAYATINRYFDYTAIAMVALAVVGILIYRGRKKKAV